MRVDSRFADYQRLKFVKRAIWDKNQIAGYLNEFLRLKVFHWLTI